MPRAAVLPTLLAFAVVQASCSRPPPAAKPVPPPAAPHLDAAPRAASPPSPAAAAQPAAELGPGVRAIATAERDRSTPADERVRLAEATKRPIVEKLFAAAKVAFPPGELLFRAFKKERALEV